MHIFRPFIISLGIAGVYAATPTTSAQSSSVTDCHTHGSDIYCIDGNGKEVLVSATSTPTTGVPAQYTGCHSHGSESYCMDADGNDVLVQAEGTATETSSTDSHSAQASEESSGETKQNCHFHAGVEHCVGEGESEGGSSGASCGVRSRDYDIPLRIGTLFVVLVTSSIGVFAPMLLMKLPSASINGVVSTVIKQFGTGIIIATGFIHLYTHANLMFTNDCLGELEYEATTSAVVVAGIFIAFLLEYIGHRIIVARNSKNHSAETILSESESQQTQPKEHGHSPEQQQHSTLAGLSHSHGSYDLTGPNSKFSVMVMEAGILFHSILIGLTLVVAGDSFYKTLLVVIVFHQFFEGLALGARIATLHGAIFPSKASMAMAFALITPIGMAIGLGVLHTFNGNSRGTLIALGTLDALSAGILVWVGVVDMWARDWVIEGGEMMNAKLGKVFTGGISFVSGLVLMGLLGKWA
ncbi:Zinc-regulated transporter [Penicillium chrysogenum]|uniref:Pc18g04600 protein n=2 Tax=Penicillium chrysogenum species complex TaxID=254878 RepID=B6HBQ4_PENRW|nr:Zinc-regulated transporter [Penicillium chrysogenum]CAP94684.1 Pc18g04600 [Penicillium rubens Wisconsin 54-1255]